MRTLSYESVLDRGFAVVFDTDGKPVKQAASVSTGDMLSVRFRDGDIAVVTKGPGGGDPAKPQQTKNFISRSRQSGVAVLERFLF